MKISEAFDRYKNDYILVRGQSRRTLENNDLVKSLIISYMGNKNIKYLEMPDISGWVADISKDRKPNTVRLYVVRLRVVLKYMRTLGYKVLNPELIPVPKRENYKRGFLNPDEVTSMVNNAFDDRNRLVISLLYSSGIRVSELIQLKRDSIADGQFTVIGKGNKVRLCFIDRRTEILLKKYLSTRSDRSDYLIVSHIFGEKVTKSTIELIVKNTARRAGITKVVTPHILRHSFATNFIRNNGNIRYLSAMLGHASMETTAVYTHIVDNDLKSQYLKFHTI